MTGSGKTEVYLRVLRETLARGRGALLIVPEIALTPQLLSRVRAGVGAEVAVLHSGLTPAERRDAHARLREGKARVALGDPFYAAGTLGQARRPPERPAMWWGRGVVHDSVVVEDDVRIGKGAIIGEGAVLGTGAVIYGGAVVPAGRIVPAGSVMR